MKTQDTSHLFVTSLFLTILTSFVLSNPAQATAVEPDSLSNLNGELTQGIYGDVFNTGDRFENHSNETSERTTEVSHTNTAAVNQETTANANTGYNEASRNISIGGNAGVIKTGDALIRNTAMADVNNSEVGIFLQNGQSLPHEVGGHITNTGDDASFNTEKSNQQSILVAGNNTTVINQSTNAQANTGYNLADRNISIGGVAGQIETGNAVTEVNYLVTANNSVALIGGEGSGQGPGSGASIVIANTGDASRFGRQLERAEHSSQSNTAVSSNNQATVNQSCGNPSTATSAFQFGCVAVTGGNTSNRGINRNGSAGVIETGDAVISLDFLTLVNPTQTGISYSYRAAQHPDSQVINTGDTAQFNESSQAIRRTNVSNTNHADVTQTANALADTGRNTANRNISFGGDAGVITTGNAVIDILMQVIANSTNTQVTH